MIELVLYEKIEYQRTAKTHLLEQRKLKKKDVFKMFSANDGIKIAKWTSASTCHLVFSVKSVKHFSKTNNKFVNIQIPSLIGADNNIYGRY